ncbi:hypothetical protein SprV_0301221300 [Sparganum proliferum]
MFLTQSSARIFVPISISLLTANVLVFLTAQLSAKVVQSSWGSSSTITFYYCRTSCGIFSSGGPTFSLPFDVPRQMNTLQKGWFTEASDEFSGQAFSLQVKDVLLDRKSPYQHILVFQSQSYGRVLVLDGRIQLTERDEAFYQEMISFLPLNVHPCPRRVLIIGGGDGGVAREVARHPCVEHVDLVDIDEMVLEAAKQFLPFTACGLSHPKVVVHVGDGFQFLKEAQAQKYDVIITDSTDPGGPSTPLFDEKYFKLISDALNEDGIMCSQGETFLLDLDVIQKMLMFCGKVFPTVGYAYNIVPTYTCGHIGYVIASKVPNMNLREPVHRPPEGCKFYTEEVHRAAFALPACYAKVLGPLLKS